jgi:hypothetical protein
MAIVVGGKGEEGTIATCEKFDFASRVWTEFAILPQPIEQSSVCIIGNYVYVFGGCVLLSEEEDNF